MGKPWLPLAVVACVASSFALWIAMDEWERARYFGLIVGLPVSVFAFLGIFKRD
jgi:type IV secretory pathway VirB2 component (pilin)